MANEESLKVTTAMSLWIHTVNDTVASVDDNVARVIYGAQFIFSQAWEMYNLNRSGGEEEEAINQMARDVGQMKRSGSSAPNLISTEIHIPFQTTNHWRTSTNGSLHRIS